jgi:hypothetical protein
LADGESKRSDGVWDWEAGEGEVERAGAEGGRGVKWGVKWARGGQTLTTCCTPAPQWSPPSSGARGRDATLEGVGSWVGNGIKVRRGRRVGMAG